MECFVVFFFTKSTFDDVLKRRTEYYLGAAYQYVSACTFWTIYTMFQKVECETECRSMGVTECRRLIRIIMSVISILMTLDPTSMDPPFGN